MRIVNGVSARDQLLVASALGIVAVDRVRIERLLGAAKIHHERSVGRLAERHRAIETRASPGVAGARSRLLDLDPDGVLIAIDAHFENALDVAGAFALAPQ